MPLQAQTAEKLAERLRSHPSFEAEHKQRGHHQADQPGAAGWRFPQRRLRVAGPAIHGLEVSMYAAFGKPGAIRQAPDALFAVCTNRVENDNTLGPQSHGVCPCSEGWLKLENQLFRVRDRPPVVPLYVDAPYKTDKALISEPIFSHAKIMCSFYWVIRFVYIKRADTVGQSPSKF